MLMTMGYASFAFGAISEEEASKLGGPVLTPVGAERAGNKDGTIPAWTGVPIRPPAGYKPGSGTYPDPFADEKPILVINAKNMAQYADKLPHGVQALMKRHADFYVNVYPTHRTAVFGQNVTDGTKKCAVTATYSNAGQTLNNCRAGYPFPIPKDGNEVFWNHGVTYAFPPPGYTYVDDFLSYNITTSGKMSMSLGADFTYTSRFWDPAYATDWRTLSFHANYTGPARRNGEKALITYPQDWAKTDSIIWQYLPGQRRVRLAPDVCCDTPNAGTGGASVYDDTGVFGGNPERFTWKLIGKKEMYIPANGYKVTFYQGPIENGLLLPHFVNPALVRFELRRVWVVEAILKPDKRHVYSRRLFYADEDTWKFTVADNFDKRGILYRMTLTHPIYIYDKQCMWASFLNFYDVISNSYAINMFPRSARGIQYPDKVPPENYFSPDFLAGGGLR